MRFILPTLLLVVLLAGCTIGPPSYYAHGDLHTRQFSDLIKNPALAKGGYYKVRRDQDRRVVMVAAYDAAGVVLNKAAYKYDKGGNLIFSSITDYFYRGPSQHVAEYEYQGGRLKQRTDNWYTRDRTFEKRITTYFDQAQRPYLEETQRQGYQLESATEFYYDYYGHLDKSRRDFFDSEGKERDHWITIYDDSERILREEHYLSNNTLLAFYRYTYHPGFGYLEREEILDENRGQFIVRDFESSGLLIKEERKDRGMNSLGWIIYEYDENDNPTWERHFTPEGKLKAKRKYSNPIIREGFRRPR